MSIEAAARKCPQQSDVGGAYLLPTAAVTQYRKLGDSKQKLYSVTVQEAGSRRSRCGRGWFRLEAPRENLVLALLPAFWGGQPSPGVPWLGNKSPQPLPHLHLALCCVSPLLLRTLVILDQGPTLLQSDLIRAHILITSAKTLFPKKFTFTSP